MNTLNNWVVSDIPSPEDKRDWNGEDIYPTLSKDDYVDYSKILPPVRNQGAQGSCAAMSGAAMKEYQERVDVDFMGYMSPQFIYNNRKNRPNSGMYLRDLMKILRTKGVVSEFKYPYNTFDSIDNNLIQDALHYTIRSYARISTKKALNTALLKNGPCLISVPVYNYSTRMWKQVNGEEKLGGHAMLIVGRNKNGYILRNSWGEQWGDNGYCIFPYKDFGCQNEIWTSIDDKSSVPDFKHNFLYWWYKIKQFFSNIFKR